MSNLKEKLLKNSNSDFTKLNSKSLSFICGGTGFSAASCKTGSSNQCDGTAVCNCKTVNLPKDKKPSDDVSKN